MDESSGLGKKYILSSGGSDYRSQGFSFYYESGEFILKVATRNNVWRAFIPRYEIPSKSWFSFAFTWFEGMYQFSLIQFAVIVAVPSQAELARKGPKSFSFSI